MRIYCQGGSDQGRVINYVHFLYAVIHHPPIWTPQPKLHSGSHAGSIPVSINHHFFLPLRQSSRSVALVRRDNIPTSKLLISVSGPNNLATLVVDNRESGEAIAGAELATPAGGDGVVTARGWAAVGLRGSVGRHDKFAGRGVAGARVDAEGPGTGGIVGGADALHALDGPFGAVGHHGDGGSEDSGGGAEGGQEELGELHGCGLVWWVERRCRAS